jgi:hypothetical protein
MNEEPDLKINSEQPSTLHHSDSALSVIHRRGKEYSGKIDYIKGASVPFEELLRIANKHTKRQREREQQTGDAPQNNES